MEDDPPLWPWYAAIWAVLFGAVSLYWGFGGTAGLGTLSTDIERDARTGGTRLLLLGVVPGLVKLALAGLPLWIALRAPSLRVLRATWTAGALLVVYGVLMTGEKALMKANVVDRAASLPGQRLDWYLFFWDPVWLVGGLLFVVTAARASAALRP